MLNFLFLLPNQYVISGVRMRGSSSTFFVVVVCVKWKWFLAAFSDRFATGRYKKKR